jgi:hypothetical protein
VWWGGERPWVAVLPPLTAGLFTVGYFWLFDRWDNLENPIQSQVAIVSAIIGFLVGIAAMRIRRWELVAIPGVITAAIAIWAIVAPHNTPEDKDFQQVLWMLTGLGAIVTAALNLPQILQGRYAPPSATEE